jgi:ribosomal protein S3
MNKYWKSKYFEKTTHESHIYIFKSLEIKQYLQKILKDHGYTLHNYKLNFSNSVLNIFISIYKTEKTGLIEEKIKSGQEASTNLLKNKLSILRKKLKKYHEQKQSSTQLSTKTKYIKALELYKTCLFRLNRIKFNSTVRTVKLKSFLNTILNSLNVFTNNKFNINLTLQEINHVNENAQSKQILLKLRKFEKTPFFTEGKNFLIPFITQGDSARLLTNFIATQIRTVKRHNFFFNFLKESLNFTINQKISKIQGIKLVIKGRLNNAARAKHRVITIGKIPLTTINSNIDYSESTAFTANGTLGIKAWVAEKN